MGEGGGEDYCGGGGQAGSRGAVVSNGVATDTTTDIVTCVSRVYLLSCLYLY